ncbi:MAG: hypothetical protein AAFV85_23245 [Cyanobacteria bacterium J06634_6]
MKTVSITLKQPDNFIEEIEIEITFQAWKQILGVVYDSDISGSIKEDLEELDPAYNKEIIDNTGLAVAEDHQERYPQYREP